jgi:hypothetical protein
LQTAPAALIERLGEVAEGPIIAAVAQHVRIRPATPACMGE